jgi:hypothetical protein
MFVDCVCAHKSWPDVAGYDPTIEALLRRWAESGCGLVNSSASYGDLKQSDVGLRRRAPPRKSSKIVL